MTGRLKEQTTDAPAEGERIELAIGGMTCAACAQRVEKKLNKIDGVTAHVNYATEKAWISGGADDVREDFVSQLITTVEKAGYTAERPRRAGSGRRATGRAGT